MDCPICNQAMASIVANDATTGWLCWEHGQFNVLCKCGRIQGQPHEVTCEKSDA